MKNKKIVVRCCVCRRVQLSTGWWEDKGRVPKGTIYSHGYCPRCYNTAIAGLEGWQPGIDVLLPRDEPDFQPLFGGK